MIITSQSIIDNTREQIDTEILFLDSSRELLLAMKIMEEEDPFEDWRQVLITNTMDKHVDGTN